MKDKIIKGVLIFFAIAAAFSASFVGAKLGTVSSEPEQEEQPSNISENINLPGYDVLRFSADKREQDVYFYNPAENQCFIIISVILDGEEIYTSQRVAPNTKIEHIQLLNPLSTGTYENAIIRYSCFDMYTQRELNGAEMAVKLEVK